MNVKHDVCVPQWITTLTKNIDTPTDSISHRHMWIKGWHQCDVEYQMPSGIWLV